MSSAWTRQWPKTEGWYWFYGHRSSLATRMGSRPSVYLVSVRRTGNNRMIYIADGAFLYEEEGAHGFFQKMPDPELPAWEPPSVAQ